MIQPTYNQCSTLLVPGKVDRFVPKRSADYPAIADARSRGWSWRRRAPDLLHELWDAASAAGYSPHEQDVGGLHLVAHSFDDARSLYMCSDRTLHGRWKKTLDKVWVSRVVLTEHSEDRQPELKVWVWEFEDDAESLDAWCKLRTRMPFDRRRLPASQTLFFQLGRPVETRAVKRPTLLRSGEHLIGVTWRPRAKDHGRKLLKRFASLSNVQTNEELEGLCP